MAQSPAPSSVKKAAKLARLKNTSSAAPYSKTPLAEIMGAYKHSFSQWIALYVYTSFALIMRCAVGLGSYSGEATPPMMGDFEAQRHWMEITNHLPISKWYFYDLQYWGLDYPPLTAFHMWLIGKVGILLDPTWFALDSSRGYESASLKAFMRGSAIVSEALIYIPAIILVVNQYSRYYNLTSMEISVVTAAILFQPSLMLIDHGHFQYNSVMLGLFALCLFNLLTSHYMSASYFFVLSLCYKQMALYYSPVVFIFLLKVCLKPRIDVVRFLFIGLTTVFTFFICFFQFYRVGGLAQIAQAIHRIFPFARGLWEDKVANFWCTANIFIKFKDLLPSDKLQKLSLLATLASISPVLYLTFKNPRRQLLPWSFSACAWGFFLFSFQVHEKSVLLPLFPATLLLVIPDSQVIATVIWINNVALFSMWPLLRRDNLVMQYIVVALCWNWLIGSKATLVPRGILHKLVVGSSYIGMGIIHYLEYSQPPPARYPDLWVLANTSLSFACFSFFWLWCIYNVYQKSKLVSATSTPTTDVDPKRTH